MISLSSPTQHSSRSFFLLISLAFLFILLVFVEFNPHTPSILLSQPSTASLVLTATQGPIICESSLSRSGLRNDSSTWRVGGKKGEAEWRTSEDHAWIKARERSKIMIATSTTGNDEIFASFLHTLAQLNPPTNIRAYSPDFPFDFRPLVDQLAIFPNGQFRDPLTFLEDVGKQNLYSGPKNWGMKADLVILGSCEVDMPLYARDLYRQWKGRAKSEQFVLACMVHDASQIGWLVEHGADFAREGVLRLLVASDHVKQYVVDLLDDLSDDPAMRQVSFDSVPVYTHVPMLPLPVPAKHARGDVLTHAVIAGSFHSTSKDYSSVLNALLAELSADPVPWGYHPLSSSSPSFAPNATDAIPPFVLHLVGHGHLSVPKELEHAVLVHNSLSSYQYYSAMAMMDVILPAFAPRTSGGGGSFFDSQSSSAIPLSLMVEVPLLATHHILKSYPHLRPFLPQLSSSSPPTFLLRPTFLSEIAAIKALRSGTYAPTSAAEAAPTGARGEIGAMLRKGWKGEGEWEAVKRAVEEGNREMGRRIFAGM